MTTSRSLLAAVAAFTLVGACADPECPSGGETVRFNGQGFDFSVDVHEASRHDASAGSEGSGGEIACSIGGVKPWSGASYSQAKRACEAAGKRLCTKEEWQILCSPDGRDFPYVGSYDGSRCNTTDAGSGGTVATGSMEQCESATRVFDMSGNVREWVANGELVGGSFGSSRIDAGCSSFISPEGGFESYQGGAGDGFRCCQ